MENQVNVRVGTDITARIDRLCLLEKANKSELIRRALMRYIVVLEAKHQLQPE